MFARRKCSSSNCFAPLARRGRQLILALLCLMPLLASAFTPFVASDIRVEGVQRTDAGTVFSQLPFKVGQKFDDALATESRDFAAIAKTEDAARQVQKFIDDQEAKRKAKEMQKKTP